MHSIGKLDIEKYKCVTEDIVTDEVIITEERIQHIKDRHPNDYEKYCEYMSRIRIGYLRWKISSPSTRRRLDRGNPRDAGEWDACQITIDLETALRNQGGFLMLKNIFQKPLDKRPYTYYIKQKRTDKTVLFLVG